MSHYILYIDPGSGSYLVQMIVAGALGVVFFFKNIMLYIRNFFSSFNRKKKKSDESPPTQADPSKQ